jgi:hypothetical protein
LLVCTVNGGPKTLSSDEASSLRRQLQEIRNRIVHLLDNLESSTLSSSTNGIDDQAAAAAVGGKQVSTSAASSVPAQRSDRDFGLASAHPARETVVGQQAGPVDTGMHV